MPRSLLKFLLLYIALLLSSHISHAQKILGAEITYDYLGKDSFRVNLSAYLFCDTAAKSFSAGNLLVTPDSSSSFKVSFQSTRSFEDITPVSNTSCTQCQDTACSFKYGVQFQQYTAAFSLKNYTDCNFTFSWHGKNRKINGQDIYVEAFLNKCIYTQLNGNHSSPYFSNPADLILCYNNCLTIPHLVKNTDSIDSISYELVTARISADSNYTYPTGYDSAKPFSYASSGACTGLILNGGFLKFNTGNKEDGVLAIRIKQWAKNSAGAKKLIGSIMRDLQYSIKDCNSNNLPYFDRPFATYKACEGDSISIGILLSDKDTSDSVTISWDSSIAGKLVINTTTAGVSNKQSAVLDIKVPANNKQLPVSYMIEIYGEDNQSPLNGRTHAFYTLIVYPKPTVKAGKLSPQCIANSSYNLTQITSNPKGGLWTYSKNPSDVIPNLIVSPQNLGVGNHYLYYWYSDPVSDCPGYDSSLLVIDSLPKIDPGNDTSVCYGSAAFQLNGSPAGGVWVTYPAGGKGLLNATPSGPMFDPSKSGTGKFTLIYRYEDKSSAKCGNQDTMIITVKPKLTVKTGTYATACKNSSILDLNGSPAGGTWHTDSINFITKDAAGNYFFIPRKAGNGKHKIWYTAKEPSGSCTGTDTTYITVSENDCAKMLGADITFQHVGIDSFKVRITAYVFCDAGKKQPATGKLVVTPEKSAPFTLNFTDSSGWYDVTPVSNRTCTSCSDTSCNLQYGISQYEFSTIVSLSKYKDCKYTFGWQGNNRKINGQPIYVEAFLNKCKNSYSYTDYSSPYFTYPPLGILCYDKCNTISFNTSKWLYQHDSMSYSLISARTAKDSMYAYPSGYDSLKPFSSANTGTCKGIIMESKTGMMYFTPAKKENAVVAVRMDYWSADSTGKKQKVVSVMRDLEISFMDCDTNSLPTISGIGTNDTTGFDICADQSKCFSFSTNDANSKDTVALVSDVNHTISGASFSTESGKRTPKGQFCWTPNKYHVREFSYQFTAIAADNRSPVNGRTQKVFNIMVHPAPIAKTKAVQNANCDLVTLTAAPGDGMLITKYEWDFGSYGKFTGDTITFKPPKGGKYFYNIKLTSAKGCLAVQRDSFEVNEVYSNVISGDTVICYGDSFQVSNKYKASFYKWMPSDGLSADNVAEPVIKPTKSTKYYLYVTDSAGCTFIDTLRVTVRPKLTLTLSNNAVICYGDSIKLSAIGTLTENKKGWYNGSIYIDSASAIYVKPKETTTYTFILSNDLGCSLSKNITVQVSHQLAQLPADTSICYGDSIQLNPVVKGEIFAWWPTVGVSNKNISNPVVYPLKTTRYILTVTDSFGCIVTDTINIQVEKIDFTLSSNNTICLGDSTQLTVSGDVDSLTYSWYAGNTLLSTQKNIYVSPDTTTTYSFTTKNALGCTLSKDITITVYSFTANAGTDKTICKGDSVLLQATGGNAYAWNRSPGITDTSKANVFVKPLQTQTYYLIATGLNGCKARDSVKVLVNDFSYQLTEKASICKGDSITLNVSGGNKFKWSPNTNISNINYSSPTVYPANSTTYYIEITDTLTGCKKYDSVYVEVNTFNYSITGSRKICPGDSTTLSINGGSIYEWSPNRNILNATSNQPTFYPANSTKYYVTITDTITGCTKFDSITIFVDTTCVWPGDANLDKTADYLDILDIALGYSSTGIPRVNATTDWIPQTSKDWNLSLSSGINYKHLDTNGDSVIDAKDTLAVAKNYGKTHLKNEEPQLTGNPNDPPLYFQFNKNYYIAGETVKASLYLGSSDKPVKDVYGLGMKHFFSNPYMEENSYNFTWDCELLCGAKDNFQLYRQFNDKGTGEGAIVRTDKMTTSKPYGKVADIEFTLKDSTFNYPSGGTNISIDILKSKLIDMNGNEIPVYIKADSVKVYRTEKDIVGIKERSEVYKANFKIYPNPAKNIVYIDGGENRINDIAIINVLGETVAFSNSPTSKTSIQTAHLPAGIYFVRVRTGADLVQYKLVITK